MTLGYDEMTTKSRAFLVRWVHKRRYETIIKQVHRYKPEKFLDYGAGTGALVIELAQSTWRPRLIAAFDPTPEMYQAMKEKLRVLGYFDGIKCYNDHEKISHSFDCVSCMGVLEHLPLDKRLELYEVVNRLLTPGGYFILQVPVMIGIGLILREIARYVFKGIDFKFSLKELMAAGILMRRIDDGGRLERATETVLEHKGFDHRRLLEELGEHFVLRKSFCGPFSLPCYFAHSFYAILQNREAFDRSQTEPRRPAHRPPARSLKERGSLFG